MLLSIDPGINGAYTLFEADKPIFSDRITKKDIIKNGSIKMYSNQLFSKLATHDIHTVVLEEQQPYPGDTPNTAFTMGALQASLLALIESTFHEAILVQIKPKKWQAIIRKSSDVIHINTKKQSVYFVEEELKASYLLYPGRCKNPHDGIADSICLGYAYIKLIL